MRPDYWDRAKRGWRGRTPSWPPSSARGRKVFLARRGEPLSRWRAPSSASRSRSKRRRASGQGLSLRRAVTPQSVLARKRSELRACGLSERKVEYIAICAALPRWRRSIVQRWPDMDDEAVIAELTRCAASAAGPPWMFLIFSCCGPTCFRSTPRAARRPSASPISKKGLFDGHGQSWAGSGSRGVRSRPGTCGARSIRCRVRILTARRSARIARR